MHLNNKFNKINLTKIMNNKTIIYLNIMKKKNIN